MAPESAQQSEAELELSGENTHPGDKDRISEVTEDNLDDMDGGLVEVWVVELRVAGRDM